MIENRETFHRDPRYFFAPASQRTRFIKFGVDFRRMQRNFYQSQAPVGQFTFTGQFTQNQATGAITSTLTDNQREIQFALRYTF